MLHDSLSLTIFIQKSLHHNSTTPSPSQDIRWLIQSQEIIRTRMTLGVFKKNQERGSPPWSFDLNRPRPVNKSGSSKSETTVGSSNPTSIDQKGLSSEILVSWDHSKVYQRKWKGDDLRTPLKRGHKWHSWSSSRTSIFKCVHTPGSLTQ